MSSNDQWWLASLGELLIWARLRLLDSGIAEIFGSDGELLRYDDEAAARMALLDAEFRAFDGLDETDAAELGFDLASIRPPSADDDDDLVRLMVQKLDRVS